jgi:hypothetical protein
MTKQREVPNDRYGGQEALGPTDQQAGRTATMDRRSALRLLGGAALAALAASATATRAEAARTWCRTDPVVKIDGQVADVWLSSYWELHKTATGPSEIVISVPPGVSTELLASDLGFGRHGYVVSFQEDPSLSWHDHPEHLRLHTQPGCVAALDRGVHSAIVGLGGGQGRRFGQSLGRSPDQVTLAVGWGNERRPCPRGENRESAVLHGAV